MALRDKGLFNEVYEYLKSLPRPTAVKCSDEIRRWFEITALPILKDQALSELRRKNGCPPRLVSFRDTGGVAVIDLNEVCGGNWGAADTKDRTAHIHLVGAMVPTVKASVFCVEAWSLKHVDRAEMEKHRHTGISHHPDRGEAMMFTMIHYDQPNNAIMQLTAMVDVIKVLGQNTSPEAWADTKYGEATVSDPMGDDDMRYTGRFVHE